jgi:RND family efflux transporter MFP subunit
LLIAALALSACNPGWARKPGDETEESDEERATPVVVEVVHKGAIEASISAASTIEAEQMVTVHAESTGRLVSLSFEEGDDVDKGELLARVKADAQSSGLDRASTGLEQAKRDLEITRSLHERKVASDEELRTAELAYENAQLDVRDRRRDVRNTKVTAPFSGTVTERFASEGGFVTAGQQLLSIVDFSTLVARVYVPEKELDRLSVGQSATVVGKAARGRRGQGVVKRIAPVVDATTGTVKVTVALPDDLVGADKGFLPGMYAEVTLTTEQRGDATLLSKRALIREDDQAYAFVVEGDRAKRVRLELGLEDDEFVEVLKGLEVGDEVVTSGQAGLKDDGLIERVDETGRPAPAAAQGSAEVSAAVEPERAETKADETAGGA